MLLAIAITAAFLTLGLMAAIAIIGSGDDSIPATPAKQSAADRAKVQTFSETVKAKQAGREFSPIS